MNLVNFYLERKRENESQNMALKFIHLLCWFSVSVSGDFQHRLYYSDHPHGGQGPFEWWVGNIFSAR